MILVSLGTQDRSFHRLLEAIEKQILLGNIKDKVIVQAGETKYKSDVMEIFDLISSSDFENILKECDFLICHGGVGTIIEGLKYHKKIIAAARLKEYGEHQNNHQKQIIKEFVSRNLILELDDFEKLDEKLEELKKFKPSKYQSNTEFFIRNLDDYIESSLKNNKGNWKRKFRQYGFYAFFGVLLQFLFLLFFKNGNQNFYSCFCYSIFLLVVYRLLMHFIFFREQPLKVKGEFIFLLVMVLQLLFVFYSEEFWVSGVWWKFLGMQILSLLFLYGINILLDVKDVE